MGIDGVGSSVVVALAAVLWFLYLVPTWLKRREYLATERNAVRLQQTMRILAESAEVPDVVRVEATARSVAAQQRALRKRQKSSNHDKKPFTGGATGAGSFQVSSRNAHRRLRRSRALASLVLLGALAACGFGFQLLSTGGTWLLLAFSVVLALGSLALLGQAAAVSRARAELRRASLSAAAPAPLHDYADYARPRERGWNPVPVPKPLYLSRTYSTVGVAGQRTRSSVGAADQDRSHRTDHAELLRVAAAEAERSLRAAQAEPEVARLTRPAETPGRPEISESGEAGLGVRQAASKPSRFANMGVIAPADAEPADLDEILRRRRAVG